MSLAEIQALVTALLPSERVVLAAYRRHLVRRDQSAHGQALDAAAERMEAGGKISPAQPVHLHETLKSAKV